MASPETTPATAPKDGADSGAKAASDTVEAPSPSVEPATAAPEVPAVTDDNGVNPLDFAGEVDTNHDLPTAAALREIDDLVVLDAEGKAHTFKSLYTSAPRVLIIFIRHFFCGNCQDYLRTISESITPESLQTLPTPTSLIVIGCGDPSLIPSYQTTTASPFPLYTDPTRALYPALGMQRTLALGPRPAYMRRHLLVSSVLSIGQGLKQIGSGLALKGGDQKQVGGEFLFEGGEVRWCHRMRNTRDHVEVPELREVLGLGLDGGEVGERKGVGKV